MSLIRKIILGLLFFTFVLTISYSPRHGNTDFVSPENKKLNYSEGNNEIITYYPNGNIETIFSLKNKVLVDSFFSYYPDGTLSSKGFFSSGKTNGEYVNYHTNGNIKSRVFFEDSISIGSAYNYYSNNVMKAYVCLAGTNYTGYTRRYDINGDIMSSKGAVVCSVIGKKSNDSTMLQIICANPPNTKVNLSADVFHEESMYKIDIPYDSKLLNKNRLYWTIPHIIDSVVFHGNLIENNSIINSNSLYFSFEEGRLIQLEVVNDFNVK